MAGGEQTTPPPLCPWRLWRRFRRDWWDMQVRHARERAALTAWCIEVEHYLADPEACDG